MLVDCGFSYKNLCERLVKFGLNSGDIDAILVTHEHADHIRGVGPTARKLNIPVYLSEGTAQARALVRLPRFEVVKSGDAIQLGDLFVKVHGVPHDAREPVQFTFHVRNLAFGLLTDVGHVPEALIEQYARLDALMIEANHDVQMLAYGPYPPSLKQRVGGHFGHLSNEQCRLALESVDWSLLKHLVIAHVSQKNNSSDRVMAALQGLPMDEVKLTLACQERGFHWINIGELPKSPLLSEPAAASI